MLVLATSMGFLSKSNECDRSLIIYLPVGNNNNKWQRGIIIIKKNIGMIKPVRRCVEWHRYELCAATTLYPCRLAEVQASLSGFFWFFRCFFFLCFSIHFFSLDINVLGNFVVYNATRIWLKNETTFLRMMLWSCFLLVHIKWHMIR